MRSADFAKKKDALERAISLLRLRAEADRDEANCTHGIAPWPESHKEKLRASARADDARAETLIKMKDDLYFGHEQLETFDS